ncbi:hypothetical protein Ae168Ps1_6182c [Pseudonocardia sp. Ae168_Ps1]|nr:hypothetical protein Ae168Ps1_6182c [Pseudonocardia sp. Ae168_Ps1]OLL71554.1 hypothetical protein Ae263Ps1_6042c [Pseudonocardia sp. Ae263_Ps1]
MQGVSDENEPQDVPTVRTRAAALGDRLAMHFEAGRVRLDGVQVTDLDTPAPEGTRIVIAGS